MADTTSFDAIIVGAGQAGKPLALDLAEPWRLTLAGDTDEEHDTWRIHGSLRRGSELAPLNAPVVALRDGLIVFPDKVDRKSVV